MAFLQVTNELKRKNSMDSFFFFFHTEYKLLKDNQTEQTWWGQTVAYSLLSHSPISTVKEKLPDGTIWVWECHTYSQLTQHTEFSSFASLVQSLSLVTVGTFPSTLAPACFKKGCKPHVAWLTSTYFKAMNTTRQNRAWKRLRWEEPGWFQFKTHAEVLVYIEENETSSGMERHIPSLNPSSHCGDRVTHSQKQDYLFLKEHRIVFTTRPKCCRSLQNLQTLVLQ